MTAKLTDDEVGRLPLAAARAELLEEILIAEGVRLGAGRRPRRWLVPAAAAAVVAVLAVSAAVYRDGPGRSTGSEADTPPVSERDQRVLVTAPGWHVTSPGPAGGVYRNGKATLEITQPPASLYAEYVEDREHIVDPPAPGVALTVLGAQAQLWAYPDPDDFTVIRAVVDGRWMELRGQGLDEAAFRSVLDSLRLVSTAEFEQTMSARFVTADERGAWIKDALDGIEDATGVMFPHGVLPDMSRATTSGAEDPYQLGSDVVAAYTCAWLADFGQATSTGDTAEAAEAVRVLGTSRQWPVLQDMDAEGDYPEVVWEYADRIAAGEQPDGYAQALSC